MAGPPAFPAGPSQPLASEYPDNMRNSRKTRVPGPRVLNIEDTVARVIGCRKLYRELLRLFTSLHADDLTKLRAALAGDRTDEGLRVLHSLRGAATMLGAEELLAAATAVHRALTAAQSPPLAQLQQALESTLAAAERELQTQT